MATYLSKTFGSAGNQKTWTWSGWVKCTGTGGGSDFTIFSGGTGLGASGNRLVFQFLSGEAEKVMASSGNTSEFAFKTSASLRDKSAWYHFVLAMDTTQATASNRFKMYINGSQVTDTAQLTYPAQDLQLGINSNQAQYIGLRTSSNDTAFNGYMADVNFIDGTQLTAASFGETDSTTGIWKPKTYSGSYGSNGYKLEFKNAGALGTDTSGNSNTWTVNNADTSNQVVDTPSNIFATLNPIAGANNNNTTIGQGALQSTTGGDNSQYFASMGVTKGKWCWEVKINSGDMAIGIFNKIPHVAIAMGDNDYSVMAQLYYSAGGSSGSVNRYQYNSTNYYNIPVGFGNDDSGTIYQFLLDLDSGTKTWIVRRAGDASTQGSFTIPSGFLNGDFIIPGYSVTSSWPATQQQWNFGNPPHSIASGNSDANGYGNFEYAVPSGYYALCTDNLNTYG